MNEPNAAHKHSPWPGECPVCSGHLMKVHKRALNGGDPILAGISLAGMTLSLMVGVIGQHWGWPVAMIGGLLFLWLGLRHKSVWQCRRCRSTFRRLEGADQETLTGTDPQDPLRSEHSQHA